MKFLKELFSKQTLPEIKKPSWIRTIKTDSGNEYAVISETAHYIMCRPITKGITHSHAILDFESMANKGYYYCGTGGFCGSIVTFEKRNASTDLEGI